MKKFSVFFVLIALLSACKGYYSVTPVSQLSAESKKDGFFYALPETYLKVEVHVIKQDHIKGPYAEYANQLLGIQNVIAENNSTYEITNVNITSYSEPNPNQYYMVEAHNTNMAVALNNMGLIDMVSTVKDKAFINQKKTNKQVRIKNEEENEDILSLFRVHAELNTYEKVDTIINKVKKDTTVIEELILQKTTVEKSQKEKAEEIAKHITKIKNKRFDLISGGTEVNYDAKAFSYMYSQLESLENKYLKLFTGITLSSEETYTFIIKPDAFEADSKKYSICDFSTDNGVVTTKTESTNTLVMNIQNTGKTHAIKQVLNMKNDKDKNSKKGFYYCIPELAKVSVSLNQKTKAEDVFQISQLGAILNLPPDNMVLRLNSLTGNIETIQIK